MALFWYVCISQPLSHRNPCANLLQSRTCSGHRYITHTANLSAGGAGFVVGGRVDLSPGTKWVAGASYVVAFTRRQLRRCLRRQQVWMLRYFNPSIVRHALCRGHSAGGANTVCGYDHGSVIAATQSLLKETTKVYCRMTNYELLRWLVEKPSRDVEHYVHCCTVTWRSLNANVRYIIRCFCLRFVCFFIIQDSCSWSYDKNAYDTQLFVGLRPRVTFSTSVRHNSMSHSLPCVIC